MITAQKVKELRERTGVGMCKCKEALKESNGDIDVESCSRILSPGPVSIKI